MQLAKCKCGKPVPKGRWRTCGPKCAKILQKEQLAALQEMRRKLGSLDPKPCEICGTEFRPRTGNAKYCKDECKAKGLELAIQRQKERRLGSKA